MCMASYRGLYRPLFYNERAKRVMKKARSIGCWPTENFKKSVYPYKVL